MPTSKRQDPKQRLTELAGRLPAGLKLDVALRNSPLFAFSPQKGHWLVLSKADDRELLNTPSKEAAECAVLDELFRDPERLTALAALAESTPAFELEAWLCEPRSGSPLRFQDGWIPQHRLRTFPPSHERFWARQELLELRRAASEATLRLHVARSDGQPRQIQVDDELEILEGNRLVAVARVSKRIP